MINPLFFQGYKDHVIWTFEALKPMWKQITSQKSYLGSVCLSVRADSMDW